MCLCLLALVSLRPQWCEESPALHRAAYLNIYVNIANTWQKKRVLDRILSFPDTVLIDLANLRPTTLGEFGNVKGVGGSKIKKYGLTFLQAIAEYKG